MGGFVCLTDIGEMSEEDDRSEDTITIDTCDGIISFKPSEIKEIKEI